MSGEDYVEMIEIPVSSCEVVSVPGKKKFSVKGMFSKSKLFRKKEKKLNTEKIPEYAASEQEESAQPLGEAFDNQSVAIKSGDESESVVKVKTPKAKKFKFDFVAAQIAAVFVLIAAILVTNIVWADSGMNTLFRQVFGVENKIDDRSHTAFTPSSPLKTGEVILENGVMKLSKGAVYSPVDGVIAEVKEENGTFTVTVNHSDVFCTVVKGLNSVYAEKGDKVYTGVPLGIASEEGAEAAMYESGEIVTGYTIENGGIVWQK